MHPAYTLRPDSLARRDNMFVFASNVLSASSSFTVSFMRADQFVFEVEPGTLNRDVCANTSCTWKTAIHEFDCITARVNAS